jgi:uncharacterized membrane protein YdjX (TVP38/TMEM64 family)
VKLEEQQLRVWIRYRRLASVFLLLGLLLLIVQMTGLKNDFSLAYLREVLGNNLWGGLLIFVLLFILGNLAHIPGWIFLAAAVLVLGRAGGGLVTYIAACISCGLTFLAVRRIGGNAVERLNNRLAARLLQRLQAHPVRNMVLLRTLFQTLPALNYTLALSGVGFKQYMQATLLGLPLPIAAYCLFFDFIARITHLV